MIRRLLLGLGLLLLGAPSARADLFSPGELARPHASVEGLANCTKCHPQGQQLSHGACLACHEELKGRLAENRGFHGRLQGKDRDCWTCHHEHQGRDFAMLDWGAGGKKGFDHAKTGWPLKGKHLQADCDKCHDRRLIADPAVKALLEKQPTRKTQLGAPAACVACHADEHRGQVGNECQKCHGEAAWKPAATFDHARTGYPLLGKHLKVACDKCHPKVEDPVEHVGLLQPKHRTYLKMKPVHHQSCLDCHKDPHQSRFGDDCKKCHTELDWRSIVTGATEARSFHDKTRYKLEGAHVTATCKSCHGPNPGVPAQFKDLPFAHCTDCHVDAHGGQMRKRAPDGGRCERCHTVQAFEAARFGPEEHKETRYPLEGAHRVVACSTCHPSDPRVGERFPAAARDELLRRGRPVRLALAVYNVAGDLARCETCHADPHGGQFDKRAAGKGCVACHELASFTKTKFDHGKDTKFPLEGKHLKTACASCHPSVRGPQGAAQVKYAGVETACAGCHADVHGAQFAPRATEPTDCARCHVADDWKKVLRFRHEPPFTTYKLVGKHQKVDCKGCHPEAPQVRLAGELKLKKYKGVPLTPPPASRPDLRPAPPAGLHAGETRCDRCHTPEQWGDVAFAHERTGFPLRAEHRKVGCKACHPVDFQRPLAHDCGSCHRDVHRGQLGIQCQGCHDETSWKSRFDADAHRRTGFPLTGRHAFLACEECHGNRLNRGFARAVSVCSDCHQRDLARGQAVIDHSGFGADCRRCHTPWRFQNAFFPDHERCFAIGGGPHAGIRCLDCHSGLSGTTATGACNTNTAACTRCHLVPAMQAAHLSVLGFPSGPPYDRKCYECHRFSTKTGAALRGARSPK